LVPFNPQTTRGVQIDNIYIKDIQLTKDLQDALSSAATEQRSAQSKLISAKADVESAKLMRDASEFLDSKTAMQVRYLETIGLLGNSTGTKVCFIQDEKDKNKLMHSIT
jgi:regulator of protease activity HflC (stomatin/prohibitin superfamily)